MFFSFFFYFRFFFNLIFFLNFFLNVVPYLILFPFILSSSIFEDKKKFLIQIPTHISQLFDGIRFDINGVLTKFLFDFLHALGNVTGLKIMFFWWKFGIYWWTDNNFDISLSVYQFINKKIIFKIFKLAPAPIFINFPVITSLSLLFLIPLIRSVKLLSNIRSILLRTFRRAISSNLKVSGENGGNKCFEIFQI